MRKNVSGERLAVSGKNTQPANGPWIAATARVFACLLVLPLTAYRSPLTAVQIQDNSFLIEEAYNQERGVVQHISTFGRASDAWAYSFTQEWPLGGIRNQLSYTLPVENPDGFGTGIGDVGLNYRYQLVGNPEAATVFAPRVSLLLPTGDHEQGRGAGGLGLPSQSAPEPCSRAKGGDPLERRRQDHSLGQGPARRRSEYHAASTSVPAPSGCFGPRSI